MRNRDHVAMPRRRLVSGKLLVAVMLIAPVLAIAWILFAVSGSLEDGTQLAAPAVGAGAGETGGANAIGEMLAKPQD